MSERFPGTTACPVCKCEVVVYKNEAGAWIVAIHARFQVRCEGSGSSSFNVRYS